MVGTNRQAAGSVVCESYSITLGWKWKGAAISRVAFDMRAWEAMINRVRRAIMGGGQKMGQKSRVRECPLASYAPRQRERGMKRREASLGYLCNASMSPVPESSSKKNYTRSRSSSVKNWRGSRAKARDLCLLLSVMSEALFVSISFFSLCHIKRNLTI